jgi:hypothetical protein
MARFSTTISSALPPQAAFDLLANFDSVADWDPGVTEAQRTDAGELRVGSAFAVTAAFGPRKIPLTYLIRELEPGKRVALEAVTGDFTSYDVITVEPDRGGSRVTYEATLSLHGWRRPADPLLQAAFIVIGKRAESGLRAALNPSVAAA